MQTITALTTTATIETLTAATKPAHCFLLQSPQGVVYVVPGVVIVEESMCWSLLEPASIKKNDLEPTLELDLHRLPYV